jgi:hypothetical protein
MIFWGYPGGAQAESTHPGEGNGIVPGPRDTKDTSLQFAGFFNQIPDCRLQTGSFRLVDRKNR